MQPAALIDGGVGAGDKVGRVEELTQFERSVFAGAEAVRVVRVVDEYRDKPLVDDSVRNFQPARGRFGRGLSADGI